jgi:hypothetical protein
MFCKADVLKPDVMKPDVLKPDVLWVYHMPNVADPGLYIPGFFLSVPHLGSRIQQQKFVVLPFFVATNFRKLYIILYLSRYRKEFDS